MHRVTQLIGCYWLQALPFPAHLRENRDLCTGSTGTKCFQIKIIFPCALLACFILSRNLADFQPVTAFPFKGKHFDFVRVGKAQVLKNNNELIELLQFQGHGIVRAGSLSLLTGTLFM